LNSLRGYLLRRILVTLPTLWGVSALTFAIVHLAPGDPAAFFVSASSFDPVVMARLRAELGLDRPLVVQYLDWMRQMLRGDFGMSFTYQVPVSGLIFGRLWLTAALQGVAFLVAVLVAVPLGIASGRRPNSALDHAVTAASFLGLSLPNFWFALMLMLLFSVDLNWLPLATAGPGLPLARRIPYFVMPVTVLALPQVAIYTRFMRSSLLEVARADFIVTARAKGLTERAVTYRHALRNALIPMVTVIGNGLAPLLSGAVVVETIFAFPGIGQLAYNAVLRRDYPVTLALTMLTATFVLVLNIVVDLAYVLIDPRITYA
jgi:peptide/nickel transport system permease protein